MLIFILIHRVSFFVLFIAAFSSGQLDDVHRGLTFLLFALFLLFFHHRMIEIIMEVFGMDVESLDTLKIVVRKSRFISGATDFLWYFRALFVQRFDVHSIFFCFAKTRELLVWRRRVPCKTNIWRESSCYLHDLHLLNFSFLRERFLLLLNFTIECIYFSTVCISFPIQEVRVKL